jgi:hypothetical protein
VVEVLFPRASPWAITFRSCGAARRCWRTKIERTDREIDQLVYELYGLTDNEIALVEAAINYQWAPCACFLGGTFSLR